MNSFKRFFVSALLMTLVASVAAAETKIVTVSIVRLFEGYYKTTERMAQFESLNEQAMAEAESRQSRFEQQVAEFQELQEDLENPMLSDSAREAQEAAVQQRFEEVRQLQFENQQWEQQTTQQLNQRMAVIQQELLGEIRDVVDVIARDEGARIILDSSDIGGRGIPTVIWADPRLDITDTVMRELNRNAPSGD